MELTDRKKQILKVVVEDYVRTAEPVGSKAIAAEMGGVSSATIRNELSDLTELGYLEQPHTSAGRVPSPKGYRLYVNELMERQRLSIAETERINQSLQMRMEELDRVISQAGRAVSSLMNYPAYVAATGKKQMTARRFELLPVDEHSCIVVMMMGDNRVKSQLLRMQLKVDTEQMPTLVNLLNSNFTGISADEMNRRLMDVSEQVTPQMFLLLSQTIAYAADVLEEAGQKEVFTVGTSQLLKLPEFRDADKAHQLMSFLSDSKENLPVPDEGPMKILIGPENVSGPDRRGGTHTNGLRNRGRPALRLCGGIDAAVRQTGITPEGGCKRMSEETKQPAEETPEEPQEAPQEEAPPAEEKVPDEKAEKAARGKKKKEKTYTLTREQMEAAELAARQLESVKDQFVRLTAEYDNYRKRTAKEKDNLYQDAKADTIKEFLAVYDNLERAVATEGDEDSPHKKGLEMIFHQYQEILKKLGVTEIEAQGQPFDPEKHNAVMHIDDENLGENVVSQVFQAGFLLGDKVIRHAIVQVAN